MSGWLVRYVWWGSIVKWARGRDPVCKAASWSFTSNLDWPVYVVTGAATLGDECSELRVDSVPGWGVEAAWWGDGAVVTRSGGFSRGQEAITGVACVLFMFNIMNLI